MKIFRLPDLGEGLAEAEIREWYVKVGDSVKVDQPLVSMETAKAVVDVPSPYEGKIVELHGKVNDVIKTGAPFISFETDDVHADKADKGSVVGKLETSEKKWSDGDVIVGAAKTKSPQVKAMPAARLLAKELNIDLSTVTASGPQGLITVDDVKKVLGQKEKTTASSLLKDLHGEVEAVHGVRRVMAQIMAASHKEVVQVTIFEEADISDLPPKTDITVRLLQAIVAAAKAEPSLNAWFDGKEMQRILFKEVNIGLAVDTEEGLFVPVIKNADAQTPEKLREIVDAYKASVRARTVQQADMQNATFTLSNFGMITGYYATPIIVPPAVAILGCGRSRDAVLAKKGEAIIGRIIPLSLTFDHRAVTGGEATRFLAAIIKHLEQEFPLKNAVTP